MGLDDVRGSAQKDIFDQVAGLGQPKAEGLLEADFEFDEDGNLVELGSPKPEQKVSSEFAGSEGWDADQVSMVMWHWA
jgi:hypothetical protein